jgi:hypothetical protein
MKRHALLAGAAALALAACAREPEPAPVSRTVSAIEVNTDLQSIGNAEAVRYWQNLDQDLETALAAEFVNSIDPEGVVVTVDVSELELANFMAAGTSEASLSGQVTVTTPPGAELGVYDVAASTDQAAVFLPEGTDITAIPRTSSDFYSAVVQAFARGVAGVVRATPS